MELQEAYRKVIDDIDGEMNLKPNRELADLSNALEKRLEEIKKAAE